MSPARVIRVEDVPAIDLPGGSWSRVVLTGDRVGSVSSLGCSNFAAGTATVMLSHETEELAYVVSGHGEIRLEDAVLPYEAGSAIYVPPGAWHSVANTGDEPVTMVFSFPHPDYPPTDRRTAPPSPIAE